jgi:hypothetical protein
MRSVAVRSSSRAFIEVVRSSFSRSLSSPMRCTLVRRRTCGDLRWRGAPGPLLAAAAVWPFVEPLLPVLRRVRVPVREPGSAPLTVLHVSDLHLLPRHARRAAWVAAWPGCSRTSSCPRATTSPPAQHAAARRRP